jgi:hypothetical protein
LFAVSLVPHSPPPSQRLPGRNVSRGLQLLSVTSMTHGQRSGSTSRRHKPHSMPASQRSHLGRPTRGKPLSLVCAEAVAAAANKTSTLGRPFSFLCAIPPIHLAEG